MAVPTGGPRKARERQEMTFTPPTSFTPQISLNESDVYSSSLSSVCFQPSEDGSGSRPMSPSQPSQDSTSVESSEHVFHKLEQNDSLTQTSLSTVQQYPTMQSNLTERHYPMNPNRNSSSFPVLPTASNSSEADAATHPVEEQSFVHADLHRFQHLEQAELEEMASVGMHTIDERSTAIAHSQAHINISSEKTVSNEFVTGTGDSNSGLQLSTPTLGWQENTSQSTVNNQQRVESQAGQSEGQICTNTISDHQNTNHKSLSEHYSPSPQVSAAESAGKPTVDTVYHPPLLDTGYKGTVIATPHKITSSEQDTQVQHKPFKVKVSGFEKTVNNKSDRHTDLLEHFIDDV